MSLVSIIIPSYNRFKYLFNTLKSIKCQTYKNIEIIVINDGSTQKEYYDYDWNGVNIIHLEKNSKEIFGYGCVGYVRNKGIEIAKGKYIAFCDDDDIWFPNKLEIQINEIEKTDLKMCCSDGLFGSGKYNKNKKYKKYNAEYFYKRLQNIYKKKGNNELKNGFSRIWDYNFFKIHNCAITSSVIVDKDLLNKIGNMPYKRRGQDYQCWLKITKHTKCLYLKNILVYYDSTHGDGQNH